MSRGFTIIGAPNVLSRPYCIVNTPGIIPPVGMEAAYLQTDEPSDVSRIPTTDPFYTRWTFNTYGTPFDFDSFGLINVNISSNGYYRIVSPDQVYSGLLPTTLSNSSNVTGNVAAIEEEISLPNSAYVGPTSPSTPWSTEVTFSPPDEAPRTGTAMCAVVVRMMMFGTPDSAYPKVKIDNLQIPNISMGSRAVANSVQGEIFIFPFDPALLTDPTMSAVKLRITGYPGDNGSYCQCESLWVYYEFASAVFNIDTGWIQAPFGLYADDRDGVQPTKSIQYLGDTLEPGISFLSFMVLDDQADHNPVSADYLGLPNAAFLPALTIIPQGFLQAGAAIGGEALTLSNGIRRGSNQPRLHPIIEEATGSTIGGQTFGMDSFKRRGGDSVELVCTRLEALTLMDRIGWRRGKSRPVMVAFEPHIDPSRQLFSSYWGTLVDISMSPLGDTMVPDEGGEQDDLFVVTMQFEEKI